MKKENLKFKPKRLALCAVLCCIALVVFVLEAQIPPLVPLPGVKLGLSNIVTLFALLYLTPEEAFLILIGRILLGSVFSGNPVTLLYSISAGAVCLVSELILLKIFGKKYIAEISICGAMVHNTVQICCAALITQTTSVFVYLPPLLAVAFITGGFCGICIYGIDKKLSSVIIRYIK